MSVNALVVFNKTFLDRHHSFQTIFLTTSRLLLDYGFTSQPFTNKHFLINFNLGILRLTKFMHVYALSNPGWDLSFVNSFWAFMPIVGQMLAFPTEHRRVPAQKFRTTFDHRSMTERSPRFGPRFPGHISSIENVVIFHELEITNRDISILASS